MLQPIDNLETYIKTFNWHSPSWDLFILMFWLVASVIYAFASGRGRVLSVLVSVYMAKLLTLESPWLTEFVKSNLPEQSQNFTALIIFVVLFGVLLMFLSRYAFKSSVDHRAVSSFVFSLVFSLLQVGLFVNIVLTFLPPEFQDELSDLVRYIFLSSSSGFIWLILPVIFLIFLGRHISDRAEL